MLDEIYDVLTKKTKTPTNTIPDKYFFDKYDIVKTKECGMERIRITRKTPKQDPYTYSPDLSIEYNSEKQLCFEISVHTSYLLFSDVCVRAGNLCKDNLFMEEMWFFRINFAIPSHTQTVMTNSGIDFYKLVKYIIDTEGSISAGDYTKPVLAANDTWTIRCKDCQCKIDKAGNKIH
jgi:hypothetical protein